MSVSGPVTPLLERIKTGIEIIYLGMGINQYSFRFYQVFPHSAGVKKEKNEILEEIRCGRVYPNNSRENSEKFKLHCAKAINIRYREPFLRAYSQFSNRVPVIINSLGGAIESE